MKKFNKFRITIYPRVDNSFDWSLMTKSEITRKL